MEQRGAALDVAQELEAEALALAGALDQAGDIRDGEPNLARLDDAEVGMQRREGVVRDLRLGGRDGRDEAGLARGRIADESNVGDGLQFETDVALEAVGAEEREAGRLAFCRGERRVAETALAAGSHDESHAGDIQVDKGFAVSVVHDRANRNGELELVRRARRHGGRPCRARRCRSCGAARDGSRAAS